MNCPKCSAAVTPQELGTPSRGEAAMAVLRDHRIWLFAFVIMAISGFVASLIRLPGAGVGGGAAVGVLVAMRMGKLRRCPRCNATIEAPSAG